MKKVHFILSPEFMGLWHHGDEINGIRLWALTNPSTKIVIWYDSLADVANTYARISALEYATDRKHPTQQKTEQEVLSHVEQKLMDNYVKFSGGATTFKNTWNNYIDEFIKFFRAEVSKKTIDNFILALRNTVENKGDGDLTEKAFRENVEETFGKTKPRLPERRKKALIKEYVMERLSDISDENIEIRDLYEDFGSDLYKHKLYPLYTFEILYNRNRILARNLFTYIVASHSEAELVITPRVLPKLNENWFINTKESDITIDRNLEFEAVMKKLHFERIIYKPLPVETVAGEHIPKTQLETKIEGIHNQELFSPIRNLCDSSFYASFNEFDASIEYFKFPRNIKRLEIDSIMSEMYQARYKQISYSFCYQLQNNVGETIRRFFEFPDKTKCQNEIQKVIVAIFYEFINVKSQPFTDGYVRYAASKYSNYPKPISESTGSELWKQTLNPNKGVKLQSVDFVSESMVVPKYYADGGQTLVSLIDLETATTSSKFKLDIHIYIHQKNTLYLGYPRYPWYNRNGMLFTYEPDKDDQRINFKESGIHLSNTSEETLGKFQVLIETDVAPYIRENVKTNEKMRIQIYGHSHSLEEPYEQTIGGLNADAFSRLFTEWFERYIPKDTVDKVVFVACNLARFPQNCDIESSKFLPERSLLGLFLDHTLERNIKIKEVIAYDTTVAVHPNTGRISRVRDRTPNQPGPQTYRSDPNEVRKIVINTEERIEVSGKNKYPWTAVKFGTNPAPRLRLAKQARGPSYVFSSVDPLEEPEVLEVPPRAASTSAPGKMLEINGNNHCIVGADATALVVGTREHAGKIVIVDTVLEKIEAVRLSLRMAAALNDYGLWQTFLKSYFPSAHSHAESFLTPESFNTLLKNISLGKFVFMNCDLNETNEFESIKNYMEDEGFTLT